MTTGARLRMGAQWLWKREDVQFVVHAAILLALLVVLRPMFTRGVAASDYDTPHVVWSLLRGDFVLVRWGARSAIPVVPQLLFLLIPTVLIWASGTKIRWEQWENGKALRNLIFTLLLVLAWAGATFDYNVYLDRGHFPDRFLLVALTALSWWFPLAVPFAVKWAHVMLKEASVPFPQDDFDFRAVHEVLVVFSVFTWVSFRKSFKAEHFLLVGVGAWASYYYAAGVAKIFYGPEWSWLAENHLSNLANNGYIRGWLGFLSEETFLEYTGFTGRFDRFLAVFTLVFELGAVACFFIHRRLAQLWFVLAFILNFGIFAMTGICFWKWMVTNLAFLMFISRRGAPAYDRMCRHPVVILFAILVVFASLGRLHYFPQPRVAWYDSRMIEDYTLHAIGESGKSYLVSPASLAPMEMHFVMGRLCYATQERSVTGIYGVTGSFRVMTALENMDAPDEALRILRSGRRCNDPRRRKKFEDFFTRYFQNLNRNGRPHRWLSWIGRPTHLWIYPQGELYDLQEPVESIELWREVVVRHGGEFHRFDKRRVKTIPIAPAGT